MSRNEAIMRSIALDEALQSTSRASKAEVEASTAAPAMTDASTRGQGQQGSVGSGISTRQVREHLEQLGYFNIPSDVLEEFRQELISRMAKTPPTVRKQSATEPKQDLLNQSKVRQPVFESEKENVNTLLSTAATESSNFRVMSRPLSARNLDIHNRQNVETARKELGKGGTTAQQPKSLKDMCDSLDTGAQEEYSEQANEHPREVRTARAGATRLRSTRLAGPPQRVLGGGYEGDESEFDVERSEPETEAASEQGEGSVRSSRQGARSSVGSRRSEQSRSSCALIRVSAPGTGRAQGKSDPVAAYWRARQSWSASPAVSGVRRQVVSSPPSLKAPQEKPIWKATHPLNNSLGHSTYQVPSAKSRGEERLRVHEALRRRQEESRAEQPRKTDRVQANEVVRQYVIPDEKRRDEVRWNARIMMCSAT